MDILKPGDEGWVKIVDCPGCGSNLKIYSEDLDKRGKAVCAGCQKKIVVVPMVARTPLRTYTRDHLTVDQVQAIIQTAKDRSSIGKQHDYLYLRLLATTGRRMGEILAISTRDIDWNRKCVMVHVEKRHDPDYKNIVFLDDETLSVLKSYMDVEWDKGESLFPKTRRTYQFLPDRYAKRAGLNIHISPHMFRHYVITRLRELGWSIDDIRKLTGHKSASSLRTYDHTDARLVESAFREVKLV